MDSSKIGIGIIGTGFGASVQLPGFLGIPNASVIGIASRDSAVSEKLAEEHGLPRSFASWQELVACPEVQLVSITTPPALHADIAEACIQAGKAVLCEKPFTMHLPEAVALQKSADAAGIVHAMDFEFRDIPAWTFFHDHVKSGLVGKILSADFQWIVGTWAKTDRPWKWQCDAAQGGGVLGALGVHLFDAAEWIVGPVGSLTATTGIRISERLDENGQAKTVTAEDHAEIDAVSEDGAPIHFKLSNVEAGGKGLLMRVIGEAGTLILESTSQNYGSGFHVKKEVTGEEPIIIFADDREIPGDARIPPFQALAERVLKAVYTGDSSFRPSFHEGVRSQMILDAVRASVATGSRMDIGAPAK